MALTVRYFSTTSAGSGNGTSWANRAALITSANTFNSIITSFTFGTDSLLALIGPGTYNSGSGSLTMNPTIQGPCFLHGCDSSGSLLVPDAAWNSSHPNWDTSALPVISGSATIASTKQSLYFRMLTLTSSVASSAAIISCPMSFCRVENTSSNSSAKAIITGETADSCIFVCSGTAYEYVAQANVLGILTNCRISGNPSATTGNRDGVTFNSPTSTHSIIGCTIFNNPGDGIDLNAGSAIVGSIRGNVIYGNGGNGIKLYANSTNGGKMEISKNVIVGNGGYGIDGVTAGGAFVTDNRLRDNTSGGTNGFVNYPATFGNDTSDAYASQSAGDAAEFVNAAAGDFRNKRGGYLWGKGWGVADQPGPRTVAFAH